MTRYKGVQGGTPTGPPLCRTCRFAHYMRGASESDVLLACTILRDDMGGFLRTEKYECSMYDDKRMPSMDAMNRTAWILRTDEFRNAIGFVSPQEWRQKYKRADSPVVMPGDDD
jgi:hypothetical protein